MSETDDPPVVLMVDDRADNLLALEGLLAPLECRTVRAGSGEEALRVLLHQEVAVVLLDVQMPGLDGYETARAIKARARTSRLPIIFLSAIDREIEHQLRGYGIGAVDFLSKPLQPDFLVAKVKVFLELYNQDRTIRFQAEELRRRLDTLTAAEAHLDRVAADLERSNATLEHLALNLSHDLREPLQIAAGLLQLLPGASEEQRPVLLEETAGCLADLSRMVNDGLESARSGASGSSWGPVDLDEVMADVRRRTSDDLDRAHAVLTTDPLPTVDGDRHGLAQVLTAVIRGACERADDDSGFIHVGVSRRDSHWVIAVGDDGTPVDSGALPRLLSLLGRAVSDPGQALPIARRIVERHGGAMWAQPSPGRGTTVAFTLPVRAP